MIRFAAVAFVLLAVATAFGGSRAAQATSPCRIFHTGTGIDYGGGTQGLDTELPDGSFVVGSYEKKGKAYVLRLHHVLSDCSIASTFGVHSRWVGIGVVAATTDGGMLIGGSVDGRAVVGRLLADGSLDRSFGTDGWTQQTPGPRRCGGGKLRYGVTPIAVGSSGTIVLAESGEFFHCVLTFVTELTPDGAPIRTFGHHGSVSIPSAGSYSTSEVFANADGSVYEFGQWSIFGSCGGPIIVRIRPHGRFDSGFDKTVARTIAHIAPRPKKCFVPTVVPDGSGGLTLVGGLDRTFTRSPFSRGASVHIGGDGRATSAITHFPSHGFAFDGPATIRLPSGRIVIAGVLYSQQERPSAVLVQVFGPDGSRDPTIGDHGMLRYPIPQKTGTHWMSVDLLPAPDGGAWLLTGLRGEYDLTLLPVS
jgi:hypothetical protein